MHDWAAVFFQLILPALAVGLVLFFIFSWPSRQSRDREEFSSAMPEERDETDARL